MLGDSSGRQDDIITDLEKKEGDDGGRAGGNSLGEIERTKQRWRVQKCREQCKNREDVALRNDEHLGRVEVVPVTKFMGYYPLDETSGATRKPKKRTKDCFDFFRLALLDEGIEDDDMFALGKDVFSDAGQNMVTSLHTQGKPKK